MWIKCLAPVLIFVIGIVVDAEAAPFIGAGVRPQKQTATIAGCVPPNIFGIAPGGFVFDLPEAKKDVGPCAYPHMIF